ncbi:hypothetical protein RMCBS344292_14853 [Rhizopus microsporus]|nr:hypothetical protein RMCBS344292_14853 [Rhizopus microsporus]
MYRLGVKVRPRSRITIKSGGSFQLTMASLSSFKSLERTSLYVETKEQKILLCSLIPCTGKMQLSGNYISFEDEPEPEPKRKKAKVDTKKNIERNKKEKVGEKENIKVTKKRRNRDQQTESKRHSQAVQNEAKQVKSKVDEKVLQDERIVDDIVSILKARGEPSEEDEDEITTDVNSDTDDEYAE